MKAFLFNTDLLTRGLLKGGSVIIRSSLDSYRLCSHQGCKMGSIPVTQDWAPPLSPYK
jgi:hypothetical protein